MTSRRNSKYPWRGYSSTPGDRWLPEQYYEWALPWLRKRGAEPDLWDVTLARGQSRWTGKLVRSKNIWTTSQLDENWLAAYRLVKDPSGRPVIGEVRVFPTEPWTLDDLNEGRVKPQEFKPAFLQGEWLAAFLGYRAPAPRGGLGASVLRKITTREILRSLEETIRSSAEAPAPSGGFASEWLKEKWSTSSPRRPVRTKGTRPGRPGYPDLQYAKLADLYVALLRSGNRKPVLTIARRLRLRPTTVRSRLHEARQRGFLTSAGKQGVTLGDLTDRARQLLGKDKGRMKVKTRSRNGRAKP